MNPGVGQRPGRVRQMFAERRINADGGVGNNGTSPVGWDKSYPLKPVSQFQQQQQQSPQKPQPMPNAPIYRRNTKLGMGGNKYSGNYGPKRSSSTNRGVSLDRGGR